MGELIPFKRSARRTAIIKQRKKTDDLIRERLERTLNIYSAAFHSIEDILLSLPTDNRSGPGETVSSSELQIIHDKRLDIYKCPLCDFVTTKCPGIHIHLTTQHAEWREQNEKKLQEWRAEHPERYTRDHKCTQCDKAFHTNNGLCVHIYQKHTKHQKEESR